ncbi:hypothetical protein G5B37_04580 [Rasiella rasia]|uniref:Peptidase S74 domain-containing protein n=1 Tax=Rasiella rasia TaxID=2744027 RepID=A0A6G6GMD9_9FLAO|nr:hypothetical protein [Rasiella rasia]QIE58861.1 hypothetical protein G5B37_04580 [Rasiella rasia]
MKSTTSLFVTSLLLPFFAFSQVGIGTVTPNAQLDIQASNQATPSNTDGVLIPKVNEFPATNPTAAQDGMLLFATGNGSVAKGFYYWNHTVANWVQVVGSSNAVGKINELEDAKSDDDGTDNGSSIFFGIDAGANDNGQNNFNLGIGLNALNANVDGQLNIAVGGNALVSNSGGDQNVALGYGTLQFNTTGFRNTALGHGVMRYTTTGIENVGVGNATLQWNRTGSYNTAIGKWSLTVNEGGHGNTTLGYFTGYYVEDGNYNTFIGYRAGAGTASHTKSYNVFLGNQAGYNETNSHRLYIENSASTNPLIYGEFDNNMLRVNGTLQINNPAINGYNLPVIDGTANQVIQTDGSGTISWVDVSAVETPNDAWYEETTTTKPDDINDNIYTLGNVAIGKTDALFKLDISETGVVTRGLNLVMTGTHNNTTYGQYIVNATNGSGIHYGSSIILSGINDGEQVGISSLNTNVGDGNHYGIKNLLHGNGGGTHYGTFNELINGGSGEQYGTYNTITNTGNSTHLGVYNYLNGTGSGNKYGMYTTIAGTAGGTHYGIYSEVLKSGSFAGYFLGDVSVANGKFEVTTTAAAAIKVLAANANISSLELFETGNFGYELQYDGNSDKLHLWSRNFSGNEDIRMTWLKNGNVGIGTTAPGYALDVTGDINTTGAIRQSGGAYSFPDYVFESYFNGASEFNPNYTLKSLEKVALFLKENNHLPGVQSRAEVARHGWNVSENVRSNLEKIEELYLYAIEADTTIKKLSEENKNLKKQLLKQKEDIQVIKEMLKIKN